MFFAFFHSMVYFARKLRDDSVSAFASQAAFFTILSFFPFLMFLLTLLNYLPVSLKELEVLTYDLFPEVMDSFLNVIFRELVEKASRTVLSVTVLAALWSASRCTLALTRGLNFVYSCRETRNYIILRFFSAIYTLVFAFLLLAILLLLVFGNQIYALILRLLPSLRQLSLIVHVMRFFITPLCLTGFFLLIYKYLPNRRSTFRKEFPGALLAALGWLSFSFLFSVYINHISNLSYTYGSLTSIAVSMLWLYACMYILFLGAEVNSLLTNTNTPPAHPDKNAAKFLHRFFPFLPDISHRTDSFPPHDRNRRLSGKSSFLRLLLQNSRWGA